MMTLGNIINTEPIMRANAFSRLTEKGDAFLSLHTSCSIEDDTFILRGDAKNFYFAFDKPITMNEIPGRGFMAEDTHGKKYTIIPCVLVPLI